MPIRASSTMPVEDGSQQLRSSRRKLTVLVVSSLAMAAGLLLVIFNIDPAPQRQQQPPVDPNVTELLVPTALTAEQMKQGVSDPTRDPQIIGAQGGWIQTTKDGQLAQQYRFDKVDPRPDGQLAMSAPVVQVYVSNNRVLTLRSDQALMRAPAPARAIESGVMTGSVLIRLYFREPGKPFHEDAATPSVIMRTERASYDNFLGEVTCDDKVDIQTPTAKLPGSGLRLQINEVEGRPSWFSMAKVGEVKISNLSSREASAATQPMAATRPAKTSKQSPATRKSSSAESPKPNRSSKQSTKTTGSTATPFYNLTFHDNVRVTPRDSSAGWVAENADELHIIFSMQSKGLNIALSSAVPQSSEIQQAFVPALASLTSLFIATTAQSQSDLYQSGDDEITITCDGGLTMSPVTDPSEQLSSPDDARFSMNGSPLRLRNNADGTNITCAGISYQTLPQYATLTSSAEHPLTIDSRELRIVGDWLWLNRLEHRGALEGPGEMIAKAAGTSAETRPATEPNDDSLAIAWRERVDLLFSAAKDESNAGSKANDELESATYKGEVQVKNRDFVLNSDSLAVSFGGSSKSESTTTGSSSLESRSRSVRFIDANGSVRAASSIDQSAIGCRHLHVDFTPDSTGGIAPLRLLAENDVTAVDRDKQTLWSESLEIAFQPVAAAEASASSQPESPSPRARRAQVKTLTAQKNVQVLTSDGTRAFADRLDADAATEVIGLSGAEVLVVNDHTILTGGSRIDLRRSDNSADWPGPGRFISLTNPVLAANDASRVDRPVIEYIENNPQNPVQLRASWTHSMKYDGTANDGAGSITLNGNVAARSTPGPLEDDTMSGRVLTLQFAKGDVAASQPSSLNQPATTSQSKRKLQLFVAEGDAKLESHTWLNPDHSDSPRVFFITGPHITYDDEKFEAHVRGAGQLLVHDDHVSPAASRPATDNSPFSSKGTTDFRWRDRLDMTRQPDGMYDIAMIGGIEVRHMSLDRSISTMTGDELHARVERIAAAKPTRRESTLDLGGSMELKGLRGSGGVLIHTPTRDVDCDDIEYDYANSSATLASRGDRVVTIMSKGNPNPFQAKRIIWNIVEDKVTATEASGGSSR